MFFMFIHCKLIIFIKYKPFSDITSARDVALHLSNSRSLPKHRHPFINHNYTRPTKFQNDVTKSIEHLIPDVSNRRSVNDDVMTSRTARMEGMSVTLQVWSERLETNRTDASFFCSFVVCKTRQQYLN